MTSGSGAASMGRSRGLLRRGLMIAGAIVLAQACGDGCGGCGGCDLELDGCDLGVEAGDPCGNDLARGDFRHASYHAQEATTPADRYCGVLAEAGLAVEGLGYLARNVEELRAAPGLRPAATDLRRSIENALSVLLDPLERLDEEARSLLLESPEPVTRVAHLPLELPLGALGVASTPATVTVNLGGEWGRVELHLLGALSAAILGTAEFLLAHSLRVELEPPELTTAGLADFLHRHREGFLVLEDGNRLAAARDLWSASLFYLVGERSGAAGGAGLLDSIDAEMAGGAPQVDDVLALIDVDGDGQLSREDRVWVKLIAALAGATEEVRGDQALRTNPFGRPAWQGLVDLGRALRGNLESGGGAVDLAAHLTAPDRDLLWDELRRLRPELEPLRSWVAVDPYTYFVLRPDPVALLPAIHEATYQTAATLPPETVRDLAIECELGYTPEGFVDPTAARALSATSLLRPICGAEVAPPGMRLKRISFAVPDAPAADTGHFAYAVFATAPLAASSVAELTVTAPEAMTAPVTRPIVWAPVFRPVSDGTLPLRSDGIAPATDPAAHDDGLVHTVMQDPSFARVLHLDSTGEGRFGVATHQSLNDVSVLLWHRFGDDLRSLFDGSAAVTVTGP